MEKFHLEKNRNMCNSSPQKIKLYDPSLPPSQPALAERPVNNRQIQEPTIPHEENMKKKDQKGVPSVPSLPTPGVPSFLENNGEDKEYKQQDQTVYISHIKTSEPCFNNCGSAAEWQIKEFDTIRLFCNSCFNEAKKIWDKTGFKIVFKG